MRILIVSTSDTTGGAAIAAYRLYQGLHEAGEEVWMLTQEKKKDESRIIQVQSFVPVKWRSKIDKLPLLFYPYRDRRNLFSPSWLGLNNALDWIQQINPDIVHFHWVCGGYFPIQWIKKVRQPVVWTLHDLWLFTGGCHLAYMPHQGNTGDYGTTSSLFAQQLLCSKFQSQCGKCPYLRSSISNDLSRMVWKRKKRVFSAKSIYPIAISTWIKELMEQSSLLRDFPIMHLPNPINTEVFKCYSRKEVRSLLELPEDKKIIFFGALKPLEDPMKGFSYFVKALSHLPKMSDVILVITGVKSIESLPPLPFPTIPLSAIKDEDQMIRLYNAVDVVVIPSVRENLSNMIMESLSCGTPVVAFNIGGNRDMIEHLRNGYLAKPFDTEDLAAGLEWILNHLKPEQLREQARQKVVTQFDFKVLIPKYIDFYREIIQKYKV